MSAYEEQAPLVEAHVHSRRLLSRNVATSGNTCKLQKDTQFHRLLQSPNSIIDMLERGLLPNRSPTLHDVILLSYRLDIRRDSILVDLEVGHTRFDHELGVFRTV